MLAFTNLASAIAIAALSTFASASPLQKRTCGKYLDAAKVAASSLQSTYFIGGQYDRAQQWVWISANDNFYLRQLDELTGENTYSNVINTVFAGWDDWFANGGSYDDLLWVVISYLKSGNVDLAKKYYDYVKVAEDSATCGGGIFWSKARDYKNAVTNELYIAASGYMYDVTKEEKYLKTAQDTWAWFKNSGMKSADNGLYNDGLVTATCKNNGQTQWTYNQGVILVGLAYLSKYDPALADEAINQAFGIMDAVIQTMASNNNGLKESCDSATATSNNCNSDQQTFKGILMMYMAWFLQVTGRDSNGKYADFVKNQGDKIMANAVGPAGFYSNVWYAPNQGGAIWNMQTQGSALGGLVAAAMQNC
ncbi:glycoside hydrolase family 76 protein [Flagelloscypha sp. PMI_526]|nr:glycoside hydrolase family 76 protein [Flagelloscypha sp. PMI_526]